MVHETSQLDKTPHQWRNSGCGYDPSNTCIHCGACDYSSFGTKYCEDYKIAAREAHEKSERRHAPTEAAFERARSFLTQEEWSLMGLDKAPINRPYRTKDYIKV